MISAYIDQELSPAQMQLVRNHLEKCPACADEYASLEQTKQLLGCLKGKAPRPEIEEVILHRIEQEMQLPWSRRAAKQAGSAAWMVVRKPVPTLAIAACFAAAFAVFVHDDPRSKIVFEPGKTQPQGTVAKVPLKDVMFLHDAWDPSQRVNTPNIMPASRVNSPLSLR